MLPKTKIAHIRMPLSLGIITDCFCEWIGKTPESRFYFTDLITSRVGLVVIFRVGMVTHPVESAGTVPLDKLNAHSICCPGLTWSFCSRRTVTSAVASVGIVNVVLRSDGFVRKSSISTVSGKSLTTCQRKNAFTYPDSFESRWSGHGNASLIDALVKTGYASFFFTLSQSNELIRSFTFRMLA